MSKVCQKCGTVLDDNMNFCSECGTGTASIVSTPTEAPTPIAEHTERIVNDEPAVEKVAETVADPIVEPAVEKVAETVADPIVEPAVEKVAETVADPIVEPAVEKVTETVANPTVESEPEKVPEVAEPIIEPAPETTQIAVSEPVTELTNSSSFEANNSSNTSYSSNSNNSSSSNQSANRASFGSGIKALITHIVDFTGRSSRSEFWYGLLFAALVFTVIGFMNAIPWIGWTLSILTSPVSCALGLAILSATIRRLRDIGFSWTHVFIYLIPIYGTIKYIMDLTKDSNSVV